MDEKELYINFDEYIRQGEPTQREKAGYWQTAIGLQAVDGLKVSGYLQETARRHIEGNITIDEARNLVNQYYMTKTAHDEGDEDKEEADRVSCNVVFPQCVGACKLPQCGERDRLYTRLFGTFLPQPVVGRTVGLAQPLPAYTSY